MGEQCTGKIGVRMAPGAGSLKGRAHGAKGRLFPGGHRLGDRRRQADDATIVQRNTLGSRHAGNDHVGAAQRMKDDLFGMNFHCELYLGKPNPFHVILGAGT